MELDQRHQDIVDSHLYLDDLGGEDGPTLVLEFNKRQVRLLLEALDHWRRTRCPSDTGHGECPMLYWEENPHSGAIERSCIGSCAELVDTIIEKRIPVTFSQRIASK